MKKNIVSLAIAELKILKSKLQKKILLVISTLFPIRLEYIIFESFPELDGSSLMIYNELKKRGLDKKYKFIWAIDSNSHFVEKKHCALFFGNLSLMQRLRRQYIIYKSKMIIDSNRPIEKSNKKTLRIFVRHGGPLKKCTKYMHSLGKMDYMLTLSDNLKDIEFADVAPCIGEIERLIPLGFPSNDRMFENIDLFSNGFYLRHFPNNNLCEHKKIIGWLPTFRQHRSGNRIDSSAYFPMGVPLIKSEDELHLLNNFLKEKEILLVIQMHHAQESNFKKIKLSNIILISQDIKYEMNVSTSNLMNSFDALITDYSAAYHEYILLNRPIALSIDDYEDYSSKTGFCFDYFDWIKGVYLKTTDDLIKFIEDIANGVDSAKEEREKAMYRIHKYIDNHSTQRVVDFLIEKAKL